MFLIRDIMYCRPGKVRPMIEKFAAMSKIIEKHGMRKMRVLTDVSGEQFWTLVSELEVESIDQAMAMMQDSPLMKELGPIMAGYHDLVERGRREIFRIES